MRAANTDSVIDVSMKPMAAQVVALAEHGCGGAGSEGSLAAHAAERGCDVAALAALQQHDDDEKRTDNNVNNGNQRQPCSSQFSLQASGAAWRASSPVLESLNVTDNLA